MHAFKLSSDATEQMKSFVEKSPDPIKGPETDKGRDYMMMAEMRV